MSTLMESPLFVLATALAYIIDSDTRTTYEEKAQLVTALGKHVSRGEISQDELNVILSDAFDHAATRPLEKFLRDVADKLTHGQKMSIVINLYDTMLVDGQVASGERAMMTKFINAFGIHRDTMNAIREVLIVKNDTAIFTDRTHPCNEKNYVLDLKLFRVDEHDGASALTDLLPGMTERWRSAEEDD